MIVLDHVKVATGVIALTSGGLWAALTGAEIVSISVAAVTSGGVAFAALMSARARQYETRLSHEENQLQFLREDNRELRARIQSMRNDQDVTERELDVLQEKIVVYRIGVRILKSQLQELGIEPKWTPPERRETQ